MKIHKLFIVCAAATAILATGMVINPIRARRLSDYRYRIDRIDDELHRLLVARMKIAGSIGRLKTEGNVEDSSRESDILERLSAKKGLCPDFVRIIWQDIFKESKRLQN